MLRAKIPPINRIPTTIQTSSCWGTEKVGLRSLFDSSLLWRLYEDKGYTAILIPPCFGDLRRQGLSSHMSIWHGSQSHLHSQSVFCCLSHNFLFPGRSPTSLMDYGNTFPFMFRRLLMEGTQLVEGLRFKAEVAECAAKRSKAKNLWRM